MRNSLWIMLLVVASAASAPAVMADGTSYDLTFAVAATSPGPAPQTISLGGTVDPFALVRTASGTNVTILYGSPITLPDTLPQFPGVDSIVEDLGFTPANTIALGIAYFPPTFTSLPLTFTPTTSGAFVLTLPTGATVDFSQEFPGFPPGTVVIAGNITKPDPDVVGTWEAKFTAVTTPEPDAVLLLRAGLLGVGLMLSRKGEGCRLPSS